MTDRIPKDAPRLDESEERLQWARERAGFKTATEAAHRFNWNENTYRSHENGVRGISKVAARKYARAFKVPTGWLLYGEGSMTPPVDPELTSLWENLSEEDRNTIRQLMRRMAQKVA